MTKNISSGDSGGPLTKWMGHYNVLVGITSWGPKHCAQSSEAAVWVDVTKNMDWIKSVIPGLNQTGA